MLSDGDQLQQQQVHHQYLQIKTFMLSDEKQLQQQQEVPHHLQKNQKRILTMPGMLSDQRTSHSNFMILQHQYLVNKDEGLKQGDGDEPISEILSCIFTGTSENERSHTI